MQSLLHSAIIFAKIAHEGQVRKYSGIPYVSHPIQVMNLYSELVVPFLIKVNHYDEITIDILKAAAVCHDVIEDTLFKHREDFAGYGLHYVYPYVQGLTDTSKELFSFANREERKTADAVRMFDQCEDVQLIKMCDIMCNVSDLVKADPKYAVKYINEKIKYSKFMTKLPEQFKEELELFLKNNLSFAKNSIL